MKLTFNIKKIRSRNLNTILIALYTIFMLGIFILLSFYFRRLNLVTDNFYNLYVLQSDVNALVEDINILFNKPDRYFENQKEYGIIQARLSKLNDSFVKLKKTSRANSAFHDAIVNLENDYAEFNQIYSQIIKINHELYHPTEGLYVVIKNIEGELRNNEVFKKQPYKDFTDELFLYLDELNSGKIDLKIFHQKTKYFQDKIRNLKVSGQSEELTKFQYQTLVFNFLKLIDKQSVLSELYGHPYDSGLFLKIHRIKIVIKEHFNEVYHKSYSYVKRDTRQLVSIFLVMELIAMFAMLLGFYAIYRLIIKPIDETGKYLSELASTEKLAFHNLKGNMPLEISTMIIALNKHIAHLKTKKEFVDQIRKENHNYAFSPVSAADELGNSLEELRQYLLKNKEDAFKIRQAEDKQRWITEGLAKLGTLMRQNVNDLDTLLYATLKGILEYINVPVGAIYLKVAEEGQEYYRLKTAIAYGNKRVKDLKFAPSEGFVGTVAVEEKTMLIDKLPPEYIFFESAFGYAKPNSVAYVPLKSEDGILGVLEVGSNDEFDEHTIRFLEAVTKDLASTIVYVRINEKTKFLAQDFQEQIEEFEQKEAEYIKRIEELTDQVEQTQKELEKKKALMLNKEDIIKEKIQEIVKLREELGQKDTEIERIQKDFEKVESSLKKHIANLEDQIAKLIADLNECNNKNKDK